MSIKIYLKVPDLGARAAAAQDEIRVFIAAQMQFNRGMIFDQEGAYNGRARWQDLAFRRGQILSKRGTLRKSIAPLNPTGKPGQDGIVRFVGDEITIGTKLFFARMMNDGTVKMPGGVLRPVRAKALRIPLPAGKQATDAAKTLAKSSKSIRRLQQELENAERRVREGRRPPEHAQALRDRIAKARKSGAKTNQKFIFLKHVKIPGRPFDDWTNADVDELQEALNNKIIEVLMRGEK